MTLHPAQRFRAPNSMEAGTPLKALLGPTLVGLVGESFAAVCSSFDRRAFEREAKQGLDLLELTQRGQQIGRALARRLPASFGEACPVLLAALGPELERTEGNGLATFFYLPHSHLIGEFGVDDFEHGMRANYELTKRMTAEFSIRPFLVRHREPTLARLAEWATDPNPHVRRLVSEGSRPRLPWAMRLKELQQHPEWMLPILERLKDDPEQYVRRSVANHLGDVLKDHPDVVYAVCRRWTQEVARKGVDPALAKARRWMVRHAVRLPAKQGDPRALEIRAAAAVR